MGFQQAGDSNGQGDALFRFILKGLLNLLRHLAIPFAAAGVFAALTEVFLKHQAFFFGAAGVVVAALLWFVLVWVRRLELFSDPAQGYAAEGGGKGRWWLWVSGGVLLLGAGVVLGSSIGRKDPVPAITVLGMPPLSCDHHSRKLILFLHGWSGDRQDTWKFFPSLVCGDYDFRDYDVLSIGYPTYLIGSNLTMEEFGGWLADKLAANGLQRYDQIVIVAHSIGGLLAEQIVLEQRSELKNIVLLVEMGTPHLGPYKYTGLVNSIGLRGGKLVGEVQAGSPYLAKLQADWAKLPNRPHTFCEGSRNDDVVSLESAQAGCDEKHAYPALDHRGLVKPTDVQEDRYKIPMAAVKKYLQ